MENSLTDVLMLLDEYNKIYNTQFTSAPPYRLFPDKDGWCEFRDGKSWPCNSRAGVYLILSEDGEVIYIGQSKSFGSRFYHYFKDENDCCVIRSPYWTKPPHSIIAIAAPDDRKYERLSLEEFLIERVQPVDNIRGK